MRWVFGDLFVGVYFNMLWISKVHGIKKQWVQLYFKLKGHLYNCKSAGIVLFCTVLWKVIDSTGIARITTVTENGIRTGTGRLENLKQSDDPHFDKYFLFALENELNSSANPVMRYKLFWTFSLCAGNIWSLFIILYARNRWSKGDELNWCKLKLV